MSTNKGLWLTRDESHENVCNAKEDDELAIAFMVGVHCGVFVAEENKEGLKENSKDNEDDTNVGVDDGKVEAAVVLLDANDGKDKPDERDNQACGLHPAMQMDFAVDSEVTAKGKENAKGDEHDGTVGNEVGAYTAERCGCGAVDKDKAFHGGGVKEALDVVVTGRRKLLRKRGAHTRNGTGCCHNGSVEGNVNSVRSRVAQGPLDGVAQLNMLGKSTAGDAPINAEHVGGGDDGDGRGRCGGRSSSSGDRCGCRCAARNHNRTGHAVGVDAAKVLVAAGRVERVLVGHVLAGEER